MAAWSLRSSFIPSLFLSVPPTISASGGTAIVPASVEAVRNAQGFQVILLFLPGDGGFFLPV
jgi:hypothetical protein